VQLFHPPNIYVKVLPDGVEKFQEVYPEKFIDTISVP
jgi:hypothetical protein